MAKQTTDIDEIFIRTRVDLGGLASGLQAANQMLGGFTRSAGQAMSKIGSAAAGRVTGGAAAAGARVSGIAAAGAASRLGGGALGVGGAVAAGGALAALPALISGGLGQKARRFGGNIVEQLPTSFGFNLLAGPQGAVSDFLVGSDIDKLNETSRVARTVGLSPRESAIEAKRLGEFRIAQAAKAAGVKIRDIQSQSRGLGFLGAATALTGFGGLFKSPAEKLAKTAGDLAEANAEAGKQQKAALERVFRQNIDLAVFSPEGAGGALGTSLLRPVIVFDPSLNFVE